MQLVVLGVAAVITAVGAVAWSRFVADVGPEVDAVLDTPGEFQYDPGLSLPSVTGDDFPTVGLTGADGAEVRFAGDGRPMVVNVWATNCVPCERELTYFAAVDAEHADDAVRFVGIDNYVGDSLDEMSAFAAERGVRYELFHDTSGELSTELRIARLPVTLFVNDEGEVLATTGALSEEQLRGAVAELVAGEPDPSPAPVPAATEAVG